MASTIKYNAKKRTYTGTNENDVLDATLLGYEPAGKTNIKNNHGLIISGNNGNDEIIGTDYNDTIKGGNGNDTIEGGFGVDTITGGIGKTIVNYTKGHGNDVINLTKGEQFILNIKSVSDISKLKFEYSNKNKDLRIYTSKTSDEEYITLKNFAKKDVTGVNGKVELVIGDKTYDLRTSKNITDNKDVVLYKTTLGENAKNYTGTWLNDEIDASGVKLYKKVKEGKKKVTVEKDITDTGLTIKGGAGNDTIVGTKYSDKIYGNKGNDTINTGTGNNYIYFNKGDGNDIVENGNGVDTLVFAKKTNLIYSYDKYDLIIKYSDNDTVTLKDYKNGNSSVQYIKIGKNKVLIEQLNQQIKQYYKDGYQNIEGTDYADELNGTSGSDKIYGGNDNDTITANKGNDVIDGGKGSNVFVFNRGDGNDSILNGQGTDIIKINDTGNVTCFQNSGTNDLVISYGNNDSIVLKDYYLKNIHSVKNVIYNSKTYKLNNFIKKYSYTTITPAFKEVNFIDGTTGNDIIYIQGMRNTIRSRAGNDIIHGISGLAIQNTYEFNVGDGDDIITDNYSHKDTIKFNTRIKQLKYTKMPNNDLIISYSNNDSITLKNYFGIGSPSMTIINNTTKLDLATELKNLQIIGGAGEKIYGTTGNDIIYGTDGDDTIYTSTGKDSINAGLGNNRIIAKVGYNSQTTIENGGGNDVLVISDNHPMECYKSSNGRNLVIVSGTYSLLTNSYALFILKDYFVNNSHSVKTVMYGDKSKTVSSLVSGLKSNNLSLAASYKSIDMNYLSSEIASFTSVNNSDMQLNYSTPDINDITAVMSEYTKTDLQNI